MSWTDELRWPRESDRGYPSLLQAVVLDLLWPFAKIVVFAVLFVFAVYGIAIIAHAGWTA